jgi:DNA-binding NarL/FixJ family response regulator
MSPDVSLIKVVIVDDHKLFRQGLRAILSQATDLDLIGEAGTASEAIQLIRDLKPEVVLVDLRLPDDSGVSIIQAFSHDTEGPKFIVLTTYDGDQEIYRAIQAGAKAYLLKDMPSEDLIMTIRATMEGSVTFAPVIANRLGNVLNQPLLNSKDVKILEYLARGSTNKEIAMKLGITDDGVKWQLKVIFAKLEATDRTQAVITALQRGVIHL